MDRRNSENRLYNILLPIWLLVFFPSWLWLLLIPANYLIDRIILKWSLGDLEDKGMFCRKHNWKICLAGFLSDFIGALLLFAVNQLVFSIGEDGTSFLEKAANGVMLNPFSNILSLVIVIVAIVLAAVCIYLFDKEILTGTGLDREQAKRSAIMLALITAPYLYLVPSELFYD